MANYWNSLFYDRCRYSEFMLPVSKGGLGPEDADAVLGIEIDHHAGMRSIVCGEDAIDAAYRYLRESHSFLTDTNHTWEFKPAPHPWWMSSIEVRKTEESPYFARLPGLSWMIIEDGPGAHWFSMRFRVATVGIIAAEIDCDMRSRDKYVFQASEQKDTIRGRKDKKTLMNCASSAEWRATVAPGRRWERFADAR